jgi:nitrogen fixation-related uncharacterized protein
MPCVLVLVATIRTFFHIWWAGKLGSFDDAHVQLTAWFDCPREIHSQDDGALRDHKIVVAPFDIVRPGLRPIEHIGFQDTIKSL